MSKPPAIPERPHYPVYLIRGEQVVLDSAVAAGFGLETREVNQAVNRNPAKFDDSHVFTLSPEEWHALRSRTVTSKGGRGGVRYPPRAYTAKGVIRLATILDTDQALRATDLIVDTFLEVQSQIASGYRKLTIEQPARLRGEPGPLDTGVRAKLAKAVDSLLDTVIDTSNSRNVRQVAADLSSGALENIRERLRTKGLENAKLEADAMLVMAEAEKVYAEARKAHAEAEGLEIDNIPKRIRAVSELMTLYRQTEPAQLVQMLTDIDRQEPIALPPPKPD